MKFKGNKKGKESNKEHLSEKNENKNMGNTDSEINQEDVSEDKDNNIIEEDEKSEESEIELLNKKVEELNDKYIRLYSEFDNYRKRTVKEKNDLSKYATAQLITDLLTVLDDFERALLNTPINDNNKPIIDGIELIHNKLFKLLETQGLKPIIAKEQVFDTDFHEAITKMPAPNDDMKGKVFDEVQKGYMLHDKVIRYAKVVVAE